MKFKNMPVENTGKKEILCDMISHLLLIDNEDAKMLFSIWVASLFIKNIQKPLLVIQNPNSSPTPPPRQLVRRVINSMRPKTSWMFFGVSKKSHTGTASAIVSDEEKRMRSALKRGKIVFSNDLFSMPLVSEHTLFIGMKINKNDGSLSPIRFLENHEKLFGSIREAARDVVYEALINSPNSIFRSKTAETITFWEWGIAFAEALGYAKEKFIHAYEKNRCLLQTGGLKHETK